MDIRDVSQEEKDQFIAKACSIFDQIRNSLDTLEADMRKDDLKIQASAVWISGNLCNWFNDFMDQVRAIHTQKDEIKKQIMDSVSEA